MNVEAAKLDIIEWLTRLKDQTVLKKLIELKQEAEATAYAASLRPLTKNEMIARAEASNRDIKEGNVHTLEDLIKENWD